MEHGAQGSDSHLLVVLSVSNVRPKPRAIQQSITTSRKASFSKRVDPNTLKGAWMDDRI